MDEEVLIVEYDGGKLVFLSPIERRTGMNGGNYFCEFPQFNIRAEDPDLVRQAQAAAAKSLHELVVRLMRSFTLDLEPEERRMKGLINGRLDFFESGLIKVPPTIKLLGQLALKDDAKVFCGGDPHYYGDDPWQLEADVSCGELKPGDKCWATFKTDGHGLAQGKVIALEEPTQAESALLELAELNG